MVKNWKSSPHSLRAHLYYYSLPDPKNIDSHLYKLVEPLSVILKTTPQPTPSNANN